jgi:hypothetical protein
MAWPSAFAGAGSAAHAPLEWILAQARKERGSPEIVSNRLEVWARQKGVVLERVRLVKQGAQWAAHTRNTQGESRSFRLASPGAAHGRPDNVIAGLDDRELLESWLPKLMPGRFSAVRELPVDAVTGAPRRAVCVRLVARSTGERASYELEVLTASY